jgi:molecular chaperone GrpE
MMRRVKDPKGDHHNINIKVGDLPHLNLGDERVAIGVSAAVVGLAIGVIGVAIITRTRMNNLRRHVIAARKESESARQIAQNDIALAKQFGTTQVFKDLLPTCDNIDRALSASSSTSAQTFADDSSASLRSGIELTRKELLKVLAKHGVLPIPVSVGDVFNPDMCEAMLTQPIPTPSGGDGGDGSGDGSGDRSDDMHTCDNSDNSGGSDSSSSSSGSSATPPMAVAGSISGVFLPGYTMHQRVIRPVQVGVYRDDE